MARCGTKTINGIELPANANVFTSPLGRECYVSGTINEHGKYYMIIKFADTKKPQNQKIPYDNKYF